MSSPSSTSFTNLPISSCLLLELSRGGQCSFHNSSVCIRCFPIVGHFLSPGESMDDFQGGSHLACHLIWVLTAFLGSFSILANILIILILNRTSSSSSGRKGSGSSRGFDTFLSGLAFFDLLCGLSSILGCVGQNAFFQNWNRSQSSMLLYTQGTYLALFAKSGSSWTTVLITLERYLVVAFPLRFSHWFTLRRSRILLFLVLVLAVLLGIPRFTSTYVTENRKFQDFESTKGLPFIILPTRLAFFWFVTMKGFFNQIDFWVPLPLLLFFNALIYIHVS